MKSIFNSISKIIGGTASAQIITLLAMPLISRLYTPENYGVFGIVMAVALVASILASFQLHQAIVLPKFEFQAIGLFQITCFSVTVGGVLISLLFYVFLYFYPSFFANSSASALSILTGLLVISIGVGQASQNLAARLKVYGAISKAIIIRAAVVVSSQLFIGLIAAGDIGLIIGQILGEISAFVFYWLMILPADSCRKLMRWKRYYVLARRNKDFVIYGTAQETLSSLSLGVPTILFGIYFGEIVAGCYSFAFKVLMAPVNLISGAVRQVLSVHFSELKDQPGRLKYNFRIMTVYLFVPTVLGSLVLMIFSADLFDIIFGVRWREAGEYSTWLLPWCAFVIFGVPASLVFRVLKKQYIGFFINTFAFFCRTAALVIGGVFYSPIVSIFLFSLAGMISTSIFIFYAARFVSGEFEKS
ncbi:oligosaccharide flippase family protein [Azonexus sp.]|uniref:oligosaccharide flippase family protein n=1 Tax=Azonexus sp. TaxID=1872668 RepID=UPI0035AEAD98